jgi:NTE family protein
MQITFFYTYKKMKEEDLQQKRKLGLALSGGGYRAVAFHLGVLRALNKMNLLEDIDVISSVSGGSIIAAYYALHKDEPFEKIEEGIRNGLSKSALKWVIVYAAVIVLIPIVLTFCFSPWCLLLYVLLFFFEFKIVPSSSMIARAYDSIFFDRKKLKDLPEAPVVAINSTDFETSRVFTFSKKDVGGYDYKEDGKSIINGDEIPLSFAVSTSTCVPYVFSPARINKKYFVNGAYKENLLVDGGLYDNQGAYVLTEGTNPLYHAQDIIVSDAGNGKTSGKRVFNTLFLMRQSLEALMYRIRTMQIRYNTYTDRCDTDDANANNFAYLSLRWNDPASMIERYLSNIRSKHIPMDTLRCHGIGENDVKLFVEENDKEAKARIETAFKESIGWDELIQRALSKAQYDLAYSIGTNLIALSKEKINALSAYSEWMTEIQIRSYLPQLVR